MINLKPEDVKFEDSSIIDNCGKIFYYRDKVFRAINKNSADNVKNILQNLNLDKLHKIGLVQTKVTDIELEGYYSVIEHKKIPFITYCSEWIPMMLKDALIMVCELSIELATNGFALMDIHPGNILFEKCKPIFIDFGSITPIKQLTAIPHDGIRDLVFPLWLASKGWNEPAALMMKEHPIGVGRYLSRIGYINSLPITYNNIVRRYLKQKKGNHQQAIITFYNNLKEYTERIEINSKKDTWTNYPQDESGDVNDLSTYSQKAKTVYTLLETMKKGTLLDMAANKGWFSRMAANLGYKVVAFDYEESVVTEIYNRNKIDCKDILPLRINFLYPTPSFNIGLFNKPSSERLKCDTTLVLALTHHLIFSQNMTFDVIARIIDQYTIKNSIVEFIPHDDLYVSRWITSNHNWYIIENFTKSMLKYFSSYTVFDSSPAPRKILLFRK